MPKLLGEGGWAGGCDILACGVVSAVQSPHEYVVVCLDSLDSSDSSIVQKGQFPDFWKFSESEKDVKWCHSGSQSEKDPRVVPLMKKWTNQVIVAQNRPCESCSIFGHDKQQPIRVQHSV